MAVSLPWIEVVLPAYVVARAARSFEPIMWDRHGSAAYSIYRLGAPWAGFAEPGPRSKRCGFPRNVAAARPGCKPWDCELQRRRKSSLRVESSPRVDPR